MRKFTKTILCESRWSLFRWLFASAGLATLIALIFQIGKSAWNVVGVPVLIPRFVDLYTITEGNRCAEEMNLDPQISNPCDPYGRVMNYPRLWLYFADIVGNRPSVLAAWILSLGFLGFLSFSYRSSSSNRRILYFGLSILSPVALLGIERGNIDIAVLGICALGIRFVTSSRDLWKALGIFLIFSAAILKLFPAACLLTAVILLISKKNSAIIKATSLLSITLFGLIVFLTRSDIRAIVSGTPQPSTYAFGLGQSLSLARSQGLEVTESFVFLVGLVLLLLSVQFSKGFNAGIRLIKLKLVKPRLPNEVARQRLLLATVLFLATLLVASWAYRFVFAFLVIPPLIDLQNLHGKLLHNKIISRSIFLTLSMPLLLGIQSGVQGVGGSPVMIAAAVTTPLCLVLVGMCFGLALYDYEALGNDENCADLRAT